MSKERGIPPGARRLSNGGWVMGALDYINWRESLAIAKLRLDHSPKRSGVFITDFRARVSGSGPFAKGEASYEG